MRMNRVVVTVKFITVTAVTNPVHDLKVARFLFIACKLHSVALLFLVKALTANKNEEFKK